MRGIHRWPVNSPHKGPVARKIFPFDDVIISWMKFLFGDVFIRNLQRWCTATSAQYAQATENVLSTHLKHDRTRTVYMVNNAWWRHQIETFSALLALCAGNSPVIGEFPLQMPVTRSFDVFFDLRLNKRLCKQSGRRWFETPYWSLWRHCNGAAAAAL